MDNSGPKHPTAQHSSTYAVANRVESIDMNEQEADIICRMHKLVGDKWELIAGRIPGRTAKDIEIFWLTKNNKDSLNSVQQS